MWSIPKRSCSSSASWRGCDWVSQPAPTVTWADSDGIPDVTSHTCRSCTSTTCGWPASVRPISCGSRPRGAASSSTRPDSRSSPQPERSISPATISAAIPSASAKPVTRISAPATAVAMKANRSVSTCWKAPSTLRLRRSAPASTNVAARLTAMPASATTSTIVPSTSGGSIRRRTPSTRITAASATSVTPLSWADRISARLSPNVKPPAAGRRARRGGRERECDRAGVGEHVRGVGEQRQRGGEDARHHLHRHEAEDQAEREPEPAAVGLRRMRMTVVMMTVPHGRDGDSA